MFLYYFSIRDIPFLCFAEYLCLTRYQNSNLLKNEFVQKLSITGKFTSNQDGTVIELTCEL